MINCDFLIFNHCNHYIKEPISFLAGWFCYLDSIHALKNKWTFVIKRNIGVRSLKSVNIIWWWNDIDSFINGKICVIKCITDIQNPGSESMHSCNNNVDYEVISIFLLTVGLIKINTLNLITLIYIVAYNKFQIRHNRHLP